MHKWIWSSHYNGQFTTTSVYSLITNDHGYSIISSFKWSNIWKLKVPAKIQFFLWKLLNNDIHVWENLIKRDILVSTSYALCEEGIKDVDHLFFQCVPLRAIWSESSVSPEADRPTRSRWASYFNQA